MKRLYTPLIVLAALLVLASCGGSRKAVVLDSDTPMSLSEKALDRFNARDYNTSILYQQAIIDRYESDPNYEKEIAWAYYEIGFCHYYMKRYDKANEYFDIVINRYSVQAARTLAQKLKYQITEIQHKKNPPPTLSTE